MQLYQYEGTLCNTCTLTAEALLLHEKFNIFKATVSLIIMPGTRCSLLFSVGKGTSLPTKLMTIPSASVLLHV